MATTKTSKKRISELLDLYENRDTLQDRIDEMIRNDNGDDVQ